MASIYDMTPTGYREWFMNSRKFRFGDQNKPIAYLPQNGLDDVMAVSLLEAQIPFTFYTINSGNNLLYFTLTIGNASALYVITIPPGNYTSATIATAISSAPYTPYGSVTAGSNPLIVSYSDSTGKLSFSVSSSMAANSPQLTFVNPNPSQFTFGGMCLLPLGFLTGGRQPNIPLSTTPASPPNTIALGGPAYLMVHGSFGMGGNSDLMVNEMGDSSGVGNLIGAIPVNTVPQGTISWKNPAPKGGFFNISMNKLVMAEFWVTSGDDDNTILDFNGQSFQLKLGFLTRNSGNVFLGGKGGEKGVTTSQGY